MTELTQRVHPTDLELAALISSKICHDVIGPVGAIYNGLEILNEDDDAEAKSYALSVIRNVTEQASARLQFARFAFGAAGSAGSLIDLGTAEQISRGFIGNNKHKLHWQGLAGHMAKDKVKLLLNLIAVSVTALPRGGDIEVIMSGTTEVPNFVLRCKGTGARAPQHLTEFITGEGIPPLDAMTIQAYYTWRLAQSAGMPLSIVKDGNDVLLSALS
ncbi:histidine phosphotransferase ChpT [Hyphomicrobium sp.]|uniref:histidine phosphotransferase ChpT n=1 Tax=Hyphomicrobium sp. TaxID=82 RepID=UPI002E303DD9|nr:histidine phosphotransferase family protein [Hyphomicrobium sp.]HEX2840251.1 histidine phosphotransferase family protein [Hyphomicrobium sp.]